MSVRVLQVLRKQMPFERKRRELEGWGETSDGLVKGRGRGGAQGSKSLGLQPGSEKVLAR